MLRHVNSIGRARAVATRAILCCMLLQAPLLQCAERPYAVDQKWTKADGLPSSGITGITRTADGFLWVATTKGLVRFDGARFDRFTLPLPPREISYLTSGPDSRVYVGTYGAGFATIQRNQVQTFTRAEVLKGLRISMILPVGDNEAWVGTHNGILYHFQSNKLTEVGSGVLPGAAIYGLAKTPDGVVWVGTGAGLFQLRNGQMTPYRPRKPLPFPCISDLAVTSSGSVFAATDRGLLKIERDQWRLWTVKDGLPNDYVEVLASAENDVWIGTSGGPAKLSGDVLEQLGDPTCRVFSLLPDADGGVWYGCEDVGGLHRLSYPFSRNVPMPKPVSGALVYSLVEDRAGSVWMATNRGLCRWNNNTATLYAAKDGLPSNVVRSVSLAPDNSIWIGSDSGFANINKGRIRAFPSSPKGSLNFVYAILQDKSGTVWVGTDQGLQRRRNGETQFKAVEPVKSTVWSIREDSKANVWVTTDDLGIFRFSSGPVLRYGRDSGLTTNTAGDTLETLNGDVWVATRRGLARIRDGRCAHLDTANGLPPGPILALLDDRQGRFWIRLTGGIFVVKIAELNRVIDAGSGTLNGRFIGAEDGFGEELANTAGQNSIMQHHTGEIWFALVNGAAEVDPLALPQKATMLMPAVLRVVTDAGERDLTKPIVLEPADRNLRFSFSAPALTGAKSLEYRYRLSGFDRQWRTMGAPSPVMYTALPPGKYRFEVSARRPFESWSNASAPIDLRVLPHFYQTWWWYLLTAFAFLLTIHAFYRWRLARVRKQFAVLMAERVDERSRVARELHDTVSRSLVGIRAQLDAAQVLLKRDPPALATYLENVSQLARDASKETRMSIFALRSPELSGLSLEQMLQQSAAGFSLNTSIKVVDDVRGPLPDLCESAKHEILRILEEAFANVQLHSGAKRVVLSARNDGNHLLIEVQDDGEGFDSPVTTEPPRGHYGVMGMRERARRIKGKLSVQSTRGSGTKVSLETPVRFDWRWASFWNRLIASFRRTGPTPAASPQSASIPTTKPSSQKRAS